MQRAIIPHLLDNLSDKVKVVESYCNTLSGSDEHQIHFDVEAITRTFSSVIKGMNVTEVCGILNSHVANATKTDPLWSGPKSLW